MREHMNTEQDTVRELRALGEEVCWRAVEARDARFDDTFVYAVSSTGVYCKPSCPSRKARRERVRFFASCDSAEAGGFRACRRCRPRAAASVDPRVRLVLRVCHAVETWDEGTPSLEELGRELRVSPHHLQRTFKAITGITPRQYAAAHRLRQFKARMKEGDAVSGAMYEAGYGSSSRLYEKASEQLGMTPAVYGRGGAGMSIGYTTADTSLGRVLVAATARGVCAVTFGERDAELEAALAAEYPAADINRDEGGAAEWLQSVLSHVEGTEPRLELPLDLRATAFRLRVWEELRRIPYGATRSYKQVAEAIGQPTASRAVASACAANPVALVTPCHRVVRGDGDPGGYRWGIERKRALLTQEKQQAVSSKQ
ncbi:MAG TPA: bifunctional DNA-binding transcriptional regulator/O6-methylguanine-DNA methyltransferase Ada [Pyrinomonadaceae bacterium]|nr:bifunctional DNA-binding transcriptional regulator/O6-methylguanine-DNA methyltransferase Ada [Pyrinomonadaceae bacterium]